MADLLPGDLIFLLCDGSDFSRAIVDVSAPELLLDHVGILTEGNLVVEANSKTGVTATPLPDFLKRAPHSPTDCGWRASRVPADSGVDLKSACSRALEYIGQAYNWKFVPTPGALYCSELVQRCYLRADGSPFFPSIAMDFRGADGDIHPFWLNHFRNLGMDVPQGEPGTSPRSIYQATLPLEI